MIQSICIEYRRIGSSEWKLYKYISVHEEESGTSEILLLRKAFEEFFSFRAVVFITESIAIKIYDRKIQDWKEIEIKENK